MKTEFILQNSTFKSYLVQIEELEKNRFFCKHDLYHLVETARIMLLENEKSKRFTSDVIVATALLHDLGRLDEYNGGLSHEQAGVIISKKILNECKFDEKEILQITKAISQHRQENEDDLSALLYFADKRSRQCYNCRAKNDCYWDSKLKNKEYYK